ncbi:putative pentatricopeptide repeat-containing protein At3g47840 [Amborella trichopoda]|uniref:putative pentatricopeptide repeat-containing protein At3g47840 n=1 Tax=Amborella trichopoda TaxID=13333 RepID=UPI0009BEEE55|nr:putative pentatricopeptide repeat-containing protein At3g47840 [Amborella trichopoda]|eukprot:XP_011626202.2 putative pentatricopeptide repeat-containing protein At3g47840 [Amborella trichopoda]
MFFLGDWVSLIALKAMTFISPSINFSIKKLCTLSRVNRNGDTNLLEKKRILTHMVQMGSPIDLFEANNLMSQLVKSKNLAQAHQLFEIMPQRDEVSWTTLIGGHINGSQPFEALALFSRMREEGTRIDEFVLSLILKACGTTNQLKQGESLHGFSVKTGFVNCVFVGSAILDMYTKTGCISKSRDVFHEMPQRNVVSWTAMMTGLVNSGHAKEALLYFSKMWASKIDVDSFTFATALKACADIDALLIGKEIHSQSIKLGFDLNSFVGNTLTTMYNKCGKLEYALRLFERMPIRDVVSWTTKIAGFTQKGCENEALQAFIQMRKVGVSPNEFTLAAVISAIAGLGSVHLGMQLHAHVMCHGYIGSMSVDNALMTMYAKCGDMTSALMVFYRMGVRDVVSWTAMISGYSQEGLGEEAFGLFSEMRRSGSRPNEVTLASLLSACAYMAILELGKQVHTHVLILGLEHNIMIRSAIINMYSRCGSIHDASMTFRLMESRDLVSWTAMIIGCAEHGHCQEAVDLFEKMENVGLKPDYVTFIGVLTACGHAGLIDLGFHYFNSMVRDYNIKRGNEHYGCMVDLLGRAGRLNDAEAMIMSMPHKPNDIIWSMLLKACQVHGDVNCGKRAAEHILEFDPKCAGTHITLSNIYAAIGMWGDAAYVRKLMKFKGVKKEPSWSWIKVKDEVSVFFAGDRSHPEAEEIYALLS